VTRRDVLVLALILAIMAVCGLCVLVAHM